MKEFTYNGKKYFIPVNEVTRVDDLNSTLTDTLVVFYQGLLKKREEILEELEYIESHFE
jgi:hypothetical protein